MAFQEDWTDEASRAIQDLLADGSENGNPISGSQYGEIIRKHCPFKEGTAYVELKPIPQGIVVDWATKAAQYIRSTRDDIGRTAAVITTFAEPLLKALDASRLRHDNKCSKMLACELDGDDVPCTCKADEHNKRIDDALQGYPTLVETPCIKIDPEDLVLLDRNIDDHILSVKRKDSISFEINFAPPPDVAEKMKLGDKITMDTDEWVVELEVKSKRKR